MAVAADFFRHQANSMVATVVDYTMMIVLVSFLHEAPALGTAAGAACGACINFLLGRAWVFRATDGVAAHQAGRYALVSLGSLLLNTAGVQVLAVIIGLQYIVARLVISVLVSVGWNFPMQRLFVFPAEAP